MRQGGGRREKTYTLSECKGGKDVGGEGGREGWREGKGRKR